MSFLITTSNMAPGQIVARADELPKYDQQMTVTVSGKKDVERFKKLLAEPIREQKEEAKRHPLNPLDMF